MLKSGADARRLTGDDVRHFIRVNKPQRFVTMIMRHALLLGISFIVLYPIIYMISSAFMPPADAKNPAVIWIPLAPTLSNFKDVLTIIDFKTVLPNTLLTSVITTFLQVIVCLVVGYGFSRFNFKGRNLLFALVMLTIVVPPQVLGVSMYTQMKNYNLLNNPLSIWLPSLLGVGLRCGLYIFIYRQFFVGLPRDLEDAAYIDGCGPYSCFARIMVPNTKNIVLTVFLFSMVWNWNDYYTPAMYLGNNYTVATALAKFQDDMRNIGIVGNFVKADVVSTRIQAACLLAILPMLIIYIFTQRYFTESIENTGITGI